MSPRNLSNAKKKRKYFISSKLKSIFGKKGAIGKIQIVLIIAIIILASFLATYWIGNGFSTEDNIIGTKGGFYLNIDSPLNGAVYTQGNNIDFRGGSLGGTLRQAILWDNDYNVGIPCNVIGTRFSVTIPGERLSPGLHTLVVQGQSVDGGWSEKTSVDIKIMEGGSGSNTMDFGENTIDNPPAGLFQPIIDIWNGITGQIEQGTGDNDLNGDNIDDRLQSSFLSPRYNPMNLPWMMIIIVLIIAGLLSLVVYYAFKYKKQNQYYKVRLAQNILSKPETRKWYTKLAVMPFRTKSVSEELMQTKQENLELKKKLGIIKSNVVKDRRNLLKKLDSMKDRRYKLLSQRQALIFKLREVNGFGGQGFFSNLGSKNPDSLSERKEDIRKTMELSDKRAKVSSNLNSLDYKMEEYNLEKEKLRLKDSLLRYRKENPEDAKGIRQYLKKISLLEAKQDMILDKYKKDIARANYERMQERKQFENIMEKIEKEKKELEKNKGVKILIVPKVKFRFKPKSKTGKEGRRVLLPQSEIPGVHRKLPPPPPGYLPRARPRQRPRPNRGIEYGRRKNKKRNK